MKDDISRAIYTAEKLMDFFDGQGASISDQINGISAYLGMLCSEGFTNTEKLGSLIDLSRSFSKVSLYMKEIEKNIHKEKNDIQS